MDGDAWKTRTAAYHNARLEYSQIRLYTESDFKSEGADCMCAGHIYTYIHTFSHTAEKYVPEEGRMG